MLNVLLAKVLCLILKFLKNNLKMQQIIKVLKNQCIGERFFIK